MLIIRRHHRRPCCLPRACRRCCVRSWSGRSPRRSRSATGDMVNLFLFGTTQFGLGLVLLTVGGQMVAATENALINTLETPLAIAWVWLCFGEAPSVTSLCRGHYRHGGGRRACLARQPAQTSPCCHLYFGVIRLTPVAFCGNATGMPPSPETPEAMSLADLGDALSGFFDPDWYLARYPDVPPPAPSRSIISCTMAPPRAATRTVSSTVPGTWRTIRTLRLRGSIRCCTTCRWARQSCATRIRASMPPITWTSIPRRRPIRCSIICCSASSAAG